MNLGIAGKVALVTGASSGLGRACALALAAEGAKLAVAARRENKLEEVAQMARNLASPDARIFAADLDQEKSVTKLVSDVQARMGPIEILIANSGGPKAGTVSSLSMDDWDQGYQALFRNMLLLADLVAPGMRERKWGRIVALASSSVKVPIKTLALSNVFRTALVSAMKTLAGEVAGDGVTVNCIATGRIATDRLRELFSTAEEWKAARAEIPAGRIAEPEEFAPLVAFLCSAPASYVTGQIIAIDGGLTPTLF
ncbi:MAG: hypothetical protein DLM50_01485 [Candidatus Meridianibacter frigidus]|nr:MAG: hypothetical protein DLM50_01485 [Candidatus Eremiobacteraeota bacterium]